MKKSIYDPLGSLTYDTRAIQKIVAMKLAEIDGMLAIDKNIIQRFSNKITATDYKGINVEVSDTQIAIDVNVVIEYGRYIPEIYNESMRKIKDEIYKMTGLTLVEFNLNVDDILDVTEYEDIIRKETKSDNPLNEKIIDNQPEYFLNGKEKTLSEKMKDAVTDFGDTMSDKAEDFKESTKRVMHTTGEKTAEFADHVKEKAIDLGEVAKDKAEEFGETVSEKAGEAKTDAINMLQIAGDKTTEIADDVKEKAIDLGESAKEKTEDIEKNIKKETKKIEKELVTEEKIDSKETKKKVDESKTKKKAPAKTKKKTQNKKSNAK